MSTLFDTKQTSSRSALDQLSPIDTDLHDILESINSELTTPLRMRATAALVVTVDAIAPVNPETGRKRSIPPIAGSLPAFSSGTITIPAANNNNITTNTSAEVLLINIPDGDYIRVGVHLSNNGELSFTSGVNDSVLADATTPPPISAGFFIGEFWIQNIGGTIQNITDANLTQYAGGGGSGGEGSLTTDLAPADLTIETGTTLNQSFLNVPVGVTYTIDGQHVGAELTVGGDYVVNGTSIILGTAQIDQIGLASQLQTGLVSHEAPLQVFGGPKEYVDPVRFTGGFDTTGDAGIATSDTYGLNLLTDSANVRASEGSGTTTLTIADDRRQIFTLSAARTVVLPTSGIRKGEKITLENRGAFLLSIKSSDTTTLTGANVASQSVGDPSIEIGKVELIALQDNPTAPSHWFVSDVEESANPTQPVPTGALDIAMEYRGFRVSRKNKVAFVGMRESSATAVAASAGINFAAALPTRFMPSLYQYCTSALLNAGILTACCVQVSTDGTIAFSKYDNSNFSGLTAIGANAQDSTFTYRIKP